jgi:hypothetical protein
MNEDIYQVGRYVRIDPELEITNEYYSANYDMVRRRGEIVKISHIEGDRITLENIPWNWHRKWLIPCGVNKGRF